MEAGQALEAAKASSGRNRSGSGVQGDVTCRCAAAGDVAVVLEWERMWVPSSALDVLRPLALTDVSRLAVRAGLRWWTAWVLFMLFLLLAAAAWDQRVLYERYPPLWAEVPSKFVFAWRMGFHLRTKHPLLRVLYAVPGHVVETRLQMSVAFFNHVTVTLCSCLVWYGEGQCFVEQTLLAGAISAAAGWAGGTLPHLLLAKGYKSVSLGAAARRAWRNRRASIVPAMPSAQGKIKGAMQEARRLSMAARRLSTAATRRNSTRGTKETGGSGRLSEEDAWETSCIALSPRSAPPELPPPPLSSLHAGPPPPPSPPTSPPPTFSLAIAEDSQSVPRGRGSVALAGQANTEGRGSIVQLRGRHVREQQPVEAPVRREQLHADEHGKLHLCLDAPSTPRGVGGGGAARAMQREATRPGETEVEAEGSLSVVRLTLAQEMEVPVLRLRRRWVGWRLRGRGGGGGWRLHAVFNLADLPPGFTAEQATAPAGGAVCPCMAHA